MSKGRKKDSKKNIKDVNEINFIKSPNLLLPPVKLEPNVLDLCKKIDLFYKEYTKKQKASDLINGIYYAKRIECKTNKDWMSQSANSAREILYPLFSPNINKENLLGLFKRYAVDHTNIKAKNKQFEDNFKKLDKIYHKLTDITHHGIKIEGKGFSSDKEFYNFSENDFDLLMDDFVKIMSSSFDYQQIYIHNTIDVITKNKKPTNQASKDARLIIETNSDAKQYFYSRVKPGWLKHLWDNGFLDIIKKKPEDQKSYNYRTPEINYLARSAEKCSGEVIKIIKNKDIATTKNKFRPELIDQIIRISENLPAKQLAHIVPKIHNQKWIKLMSLFNRWGFEYAKMFETLYNAKDYKSFLILAESILEVKTKKEFPKKENEYFSLERPFYFEDLSYTKIFDFLVKIPDSKIEESLSVAIKSFIKIVKLGDISKDKSTFPIRDPYCLYLSDADFFSLDINQKKHSSSKDDVHDLISVITILTSRLIEIQNDDNEKIKKIYYNYFKKLPKSRSTWKLNLYVLSLSPKVFTEELKKMYFKLFSNKIESYFDIISGTEYEKALKIGFSFMSKNDCNKYINKVISFFKEKTLEDSSQKWHMIYGSNILSLLYEYLDEKQIKNIDKNGFKINLKYKPEPSIVSSMAGTIIPQAPIKIEDFNDLKMDEISRRLKDEWSPIKLKEKYKGKDNFLRPHNAEGIGDLIKNDLDKRLQDYINSSNLFFDRDLINPHYTYSFFRAIEDLLRNNKKIISQINWNGFFELCTKIKNSGEKNIFIDSEKDVNSFDGWLAGWTAVHSAMADVIKFLVEEENYKPLINFKEYRDSLLNIIKYLLEYKNPIPKDEEKDTASMTSGSYNQQKVSDPFSIAINTVRGKAFQAFMSFIFPDGRDPNNNKIVGIKLDTKKIYEEVLEKEETKALFFMFGHYLPSFYYRDINWMQGLLPKIFPMEENKKMLFLASWEGYLANNVYNEIFYDINFKNLYKYAISLDLKDEIRNYFRDPKEGLSTHIAIAFLNYEDFDFNHPLYKTFWEKKDPELHSHFVSFIGRNVIYSDNNKIDESIEKSLLGKKRIRDFWDWILKNYKDPKPFSEFGLWINTNKKIFSIKETAYYIRKTLEKTNGYIEWDYQLSKSVLELTKNSPEDMILVAKLFFLDGKVRNPNKKDFPIRIDQEWIESFKFLYNNKNTQLATRSLINNLVKEGGSPFWILNDIIN